jgi:hypothetical protein
MKVLLVVGLAAVIIVILIAVFLSVRLGRGDDREDQAVERGRGRRNAEDPRWENTDSRGARRPPDSPARQGRGAGQRTRAQAEQDSRYRDRGERRPERDQTAMPREYDRPQRRADRYDTSPGAASTVRRPVAAAAPRSGSGRDSTSRRPGGPGSTSRDRYGSGPLYDTGPSPRPAADEFPSGPFPAVDFSSGGYPSGPMPVADFPSGEYPAADYPSGGYPSGPMPVADFPSGEYPAADYPSGELPAARSRGRSASPKAESGRDRPDSRRKQSKAQNPAKGRGRPQRGKRDDDNDEWPSMEWDKLSDEQYWAELSVDKPLSASEPKPASAKNGQSRSTAAKPKPSPSQAAPAVGNSAAGHNLPGHRAPGPQRETAPQHETGPHREAATERLPVRARQQSSPSARPASGMPADGRRGATASRSAHEPTLAMLASLASTSARRSPEAPDDDPLTSPSFAVPAIDSRSYGSARKNGNTSDTGSHPAAGDMHATGSYGYGYGSLSGNGAASGAYPSPGVADPGYAYQAAPLPAEDWPGAANQHTPAHGTAVHNTPAHGTPAHGNPYGSYVDAAPAAPAATAYPVTAQAGYADASYPSAGYQSYPSPGGHGGYPEPSYEPAADLPYQGFPAAVLPVHPGEPGQYLPQGGYPGDGGYGTDHVDPANYPDAYADPGYPAGYPADYAADPYGHDGYGGYSAAQG